MAATSELYNEDDENDDFGTREAKRRRRMQIIRADSYQQIMINNGISFPLNAKPDFDRAANDESSSFLTKLITDISVDKDPDIGGEEEIISAFYDDHFKVLYLPKIDARSESFTVTEFAFDYLHENKTVAEQAVLERVKCAMILAHSAKVKGWKKVHFDNTNDPLSRYILKMVCSELGLESDEKIAEDQIPKHPLIKDFKQLAYELFGEIAENPRLTVAEPKYGYGSKMAAPPAANSNFDIEEEPQPKVA